MLVLPIALEARDKPDINKGVLDLNQYDFHNDAIISLDGEWQFVYGQLFTPDEFTKNATDIQLVQVPKVWNNLDMNGKDLNAMGYATYRLKVLLPENTPPLSLEIPNMYSSYQLYVNGHLLSNNGKTGISAATSTPEWRYKIKPVDHSSENTLDIVLQVSNFYHHRGGIHKSIYLGENDALFNKRELNVIANGLLVGGVLILGIFFLSFYIMRKRDLAVLYFSALSLVWMFRSIFANIYLANILFPDISWTTSVRIEYIALCLSLLFGMLFISKVFSGEFKPIFMYFMHIINFLFIFLTVILPSVHFTALLPFYQMFILINFLLVIFILVKAVLKKQQEAWYSIIGIALGLSLSILELASYHFELGLSVVALNLGYLAVFFLNSLVLIHRFAMAFKEVSRLRREQRYHLSKV